MSLSLSALMQRLGKALGFALVAAVVVLALISTAVRVFLLTLDDLHPHLSRWATETLGVRMEIGQAMSEWRGIYPSIILDDVLLDFDDETPMYEFDRIVVSLDLLGSLWAMSPTPKYVYCDWRIHPCATA